MLTSTPRGIFKTTKLDGDAVTIAVLSEPRQCACGSMSALVVNRLGKTRCTACDDKLVRERKQ